jgi:predicted nucleic acid-binding protein
VIFVDSSVWVDFFNGRNTREVNHLYELLGTEPLVVGDIVLAEVLQGFTRDKDFRTARSLLSSLSVRNVLDEGIALKSARNFRYLRKRGVTVRKTMDSIIATFCISEKLWLLHSERDFLPFEQYLGLKAVR